MKKIILKLLILTGLASIALTPVKAVSGMMSVQTILQDVELDQTSGIYLYRDDIDEYCEISEKTEILNFLEELVTLEVAPITEPRFDGKSCSMRAGRNRNKQFGYGGANNGFYIKEDGEKIWFPYALDYDAFMAAVEKAGVSWGKSPGAGPMPNALPGYDLKFMVGKNHFIPEYVNSRRYFPQKAQAIDENPAVAPFIDIESGRTMIPLRCLAEALSFETEWLESTQEIILKKDAVRITLKIGIRNAEWTYFEKSNTEDNETVYQSILKMDIPPKISNDRTFVPLRFIAEIFECEVRWNEEQGEIDLIKDMRGCEYNIYTYPFLDMENGQISLKTYNTNTLPYVQHFEGNLQLQAEIYNENNNRVITLKQSEAQGTTRVFYPDEPDTFAVTDARLKTLPAGRYYADIKYGPEEKTTYRIFFDKE